MYGPVLQSTDGCVHLAAEATLVVRDLKAPLPADLLARVETQFRLWNMLSAFRESQIPIKIDLGAGALPLAQAKSRLEHDGQHSWLINIVIYVDPPMKAQLEELLMQHTRKETLCWFRSDLRVSAVLDESNFDAAHALSVMVFEGCPLPDDSTPQVEEISMSAAIDIGRHRAWVARHCQDHDRQSDWRRIL